MGDRQRQAGQPGTRSKVGPTLSRRWHSNRRQPEGVIQMPIPEPLLLPRAKEPEPDRLGVGLLQELRFFSSEKRTPRRRFAVSPMFHVKR
jgi:hypothetical protein